MKKLFWISLATLTLGSGLAFAQPANQRGSDSWLQTGTRWARSDFYGKDLNHNGRVDDNEWTQQHLTGSRKPPAWANTPLQEGETHRWSISSEEVWEEQPVKLKSPR